MLFGKKFEGNEKENNNKQLLLVLFNNRKGKKYLNSKIHIIFTEIFMEVK